MQLLVREKHGKPEENPVITMSPPTQKASSNKYKVKERPISSSYSVIDNDLARDNVENDLTSADFQDL